jgi:hypothetical protein
MAKRQKQLSLTEHTIKQVQRLANKREWSWSKTAGRCIEIGLVYESAPTPESAPDQAQADLVAALQVILDQVDYTSGACRLNAPVGGCLSKQVIEMARAALTPFEEVGGE